MVHRRESPHDLSAEALPKSPGLKNGPPQVGRPQNPSQKHFRWRDEDSHRSTTFTIHIVMNGSIVGGRESTNSVGRTRSTRIDVYAPDIAVRQFSLYFDCWASGKEYTTICTNKFIFIITHRLTEAQHIIVTNEYIDFVTSPSSDSLLSLKILIFVKIRRNLPLLQVDAAK